MEHEHTNEIIALLAGLFLLSIILSRLQDYIDYWGINTQTFWPAITGFFLVHVWPFIKLAGVTLGVLAVAGIIDSSRNLKKIEREEKKIYGIADAELSIFDKYDEGVVNAKWEHVLELSNSKNPSDWKLAIIEADIMLDHLLTINGYHGDTVGEKLKSVEKSDMLSLEDAWDAHKTRNRIAHNGTEFPLNEREAKLAIRQYENVFKEFEEI
jgi:hypothetical protein